MSNKSKGYLPLPDCLTIKKSRLHGLGVFATKKITSDYNFGLTHVDDSRFADGQIRTPLGGFINYSRNNNCVFVRVGDGWELKTLRQIAPDEELTADYPTYDEAVLATYN